MTYATEAQIETAAGGPDRLIQLADWNGDNVADADRVAQAISDADGWIDSHLRQFNAADLARLRATPTATIARIAADEVVFNLRKWRHGVTKDDLDLREGRERELKAMRADELRPDDQKAPRASFIDNDSNVSRKGTEGLW